MPMYTLLPAELLQVEYNIVCTQEVAIAIPAQVIAVRTIPVMDGRPLWMLTQRIMKISTFIQIIQQ